MRTVNCIYCDNEATTYSGHLTARIRNENNRRLREVKILAGACDDHVDSLEKEPIIGIKPNGYLGLWQPRMGIMKHKTIFRIPKPITMTEFRKIKK
jgi:hypothetical protein